MRQIAIWGMGLGATAMIAMFQPIDASIWAALGIYEAENSEFRGRAPSLGSGTAARLGRADRPTPQRLDVRVVAASSFAPDAKAHQATASQTSIPEPHTISLHRMDASRAAIAETTDYDGLVRGLQAELRRVGCYAGNVDGDWGPASRFAMSAFTKAANAALPVDRADHILLSLVRRHAGRACGHGEIVADAGDRVGRFAPALHNAGSWRAEIKAAPEPPAVRMNGKRRGPRIVRADGTVHRGSGRIIATLPSGPAINQNDVSPVHTGTATPFATVTPSFGDGRMALGVPVAVTPGARPVTVPQAPSRSQAWRAAPTRARRSSAPPRRSYERPSRRRFSYGSRRRRSWQQKVHDPINLNGS